MSHATIQLTRKKSRKQDIIDALVESTVRFHPLDLSSDNNVYAIRKLARLIQMALDAGISSESVIGIIKFGANYAILKEGDKS